MVARVFAQPFEDVAHVVGVLNRIRDRLQGRLVGAVDGQLVAGSLAHQRTLSETRRISRNASIAPSSSQQVSAAVAIERTSARASCASGRCEASSSAIVDAAT